MLLVPRQLQRSGMTGTVPYYGGRFTPAQAYAVSHPQPQPPAPPPEPPALQALHYLRDTGVISAQEHDTIAARVPR